MAYKRVDYERQILRLFLRNKRILSNYRIEVPLTLMSSVRRIILRTIYEFYESHVRHLKRQVMGKKLLLAELEQRRIKKKRTQELMAVEVREIFRIKDVENIKILVSKLEQEVKRDHIIDVTVGAGEKAYHGEVDKAEEMLRRYTVESLSAVGQEQPIVSVRNTEEANSILAKRRAHPEEYAGIKTGFDAIDNYLQGLFRREIVSIMAPTGYGKSTFARALILGMLKSNGKALGVLHISNEEDRDQIRFKYYSVLTQVEYPKFKTAAATPAEVKSAGKKMRRIWNSKSDIHIKRIPAYSDISHVEQVYAMLVDEGNPIDILLIDWAEQMKPLDPTPDSYEGEARVYSDILNFAYDRNLVGLICSQCTSEAYGADDIDSGSLKLITGSKKKPFICHVVMFIKSIGDDKDKTENRKRRATKKSYRRLKLRDGSNRATCMVLKSRDVPTFYFKYDIHPSTGIIYEAPGTYTEHSWR